ncbi:nitroreductase [Hypoxylon fuscum]|nr:nitroreductase [Hypoxylon fuscum]
MADLSSLLEARYGITTGTADLDTSTTLPPNAAATLETLLQHKSVRHFLPTPLPPSTLPLLIAAAQSAATSSNLQTWSVVSLTDPARKAAAAALCGAQDFIRAAPLLLVFCADLSRLTAASAAHGTPGAGLRFAEMYTMAALDAALAGQNAAVAAEALGLGACYVGAARNRPRELAGLLALPPRVVALFGLAVGAPDPARPAEVKPRLPPREVLHEETWDDGAQTENFAAYDETLAGFNARQGRGDAPTWTYRSAHRIATVESLHGRDILRQVLEERGFDMR